MSKDSDLLQDELEKVALEDPTEEPTVETPETPAEETNDDQWDKARQAQDQKLANIDKKVERLTGSIGTLETQLSSKDEQIAALQSQIADSKAEADVKASTKLDPDIHGADLVNAVTSLEGKISALESEKGTLAEKVNRFESQCELVAAAEASSQVREEILSDLDEDYGAKYRAAAVTKANAHVEETGEIPATPMAARKLMKKFYIAEKKADESSSKTKVRQDTKGGGLGFNEPVGKTGSLDDVAADMMKSGKFTGGLPGPGD